MLLMIYLLIGLIIGLIAYSQLNPEEYNNTFKIWFFILSIFFMGTSFNYSYYKGDF